MPWSNDSSLTPCKNPVNLMNRFREKTSVIFSPIQIILQDESVIFSPIQFCHFQPNSNYFAPTLGRQEFSKKENTSWYLFHEKGIIWKRFILGTVFTLCPYFMQCGELKTAFGNAVVIAAEVSSGDGKKHCRIWSFFETWNFH